MGRLGRGEFLFSVQGRYQSIKEKWDTNTYAYYAFGSIKNNKSSKQVYTEHITLFNGIIDYQYMKKEEQSYTYKPIINECGEKIIMQAVKIVACFFNNEAFVSCSAAENRVLVKAINSCCIHSVSDRIVEIRTISDYYFSKP